MNLLLRGLLLRRNQLQITIIRQKSKLSITNPRPPHFDRALIETLCVPHFDTIKKPKHLPHYDSCTQNVIVIDNTENPYEAFLSKLVLKSFNESKMIAFFHHNSMTPEEVFQNKLVLKKIGMKLYFANNKVVQNGLCGTTYEPVTLLFRSRTAYAPSQDNDINKLLNIQKKLVKLNLMAALVHNKLLSFSELEYYGKIESLEEARVKLLGVINSVSQNFIQKITHQSNHLVQLLAIHQDSSKH